jgi:hypothetical protein
VHRSVAKLQLVVVEAGAFAPEHQRHRAVGGRQQRAPGGIARVQRLQLDAPAARRAAQHPAAVGHGLGQGREHRGRRDQIVGAGGHRLGVAVRGLSGATSTSRDRPMVFIARAAEPMLPGCWVPTRTMRTSGAGADSSWVSIREW